MCSNMWRATSIKSAILVFPYFFGVYYLRKQWEIACYVWSRAVMMARYALPRVLSRPSAVSGGGPRVTVGGPDFNPSHALHQRVKSEDKGEPAASRQLVIVAV